jgi:hypothetical protein
MLGRRSVSLGATVQAINIAIHVTTEQKSNISKEMALELNQTLEVNQS